MNRFFLFIVYLVYVSVVFCLSDCSPSDDFQNPFAATSTDFQRWGPRLPDDAIMPDAETVQSVEDWSKRAFSWNKSPETAENYQLSDTTSCVMSQTLPFSFLYGGVHSSEALPNWKFETVDIDRLNRLYTWTDPKTGLKVSVRTRLFERFAGIDWVLYFENTGEKETPLIENVKTLDMYAVVGKANQSNIVHTLYGDNHGPTGCTPAKFPLKNGESRRFAPIGGKSSNGVFPFWNIQSAATDDSEASYGMFVVVGWSGQWETNFNRQRDGRMQITAGVEHIATVLYPGESIRQPRTLIMPWKDNRTNAQVLFRRLLMFEYAPKPNHDLPVQMPVAGQCFDRYWWDYSLPPAQLHQQWGGHPWGTFDGQIAWTKILNKAGFTHHWLDAGWFQDGWWRGAGNWYPDTVRFPQGVEPLGKAVHDLGMKFILWIEPERALLRSSFYQAHPDYFFSSIGQQFMGLEQTHFKLNDPEARNFMTAFLHEWINRNRVDVLRIDYNIDPLSYWKANDAENRQGMTEALYVAGHYEMWSQLIRDNPGLWIDNCASGGRRIDLETTALSVPLWSSDAGCSPDTPVEWQQSVTLGMAQYLPLFSCAVWESDPYSFRSCANMGAVASFNYMDSDYDAERAKSACTEAKVYQKFWYGDFYPLTEVKPGNAGMLAWQLHREDLNAGIAYVFRQEACPYTGFQLSLHAIDLNATYEVTIKKDLSKGISKTLSGSQLAEIQIVMPEKKSATVIEYRKIISI